MSVYQASPIKRTRATKAEMAERAEFLIDYAKAHGPVTVRQLFYAATVADLIEKSESGYSKIQTQVLSLRREGRLPYHCIADATRYMRKPTTHDGWEAALEATARTYRKSLWADSDVEVELWIEKSALAGVVYPVTAEYDVPLMPTGGFSSETFAHDAVAAVGEDKRLVVYSLYDFVRAGQDASASLREKLMRFGGEFGVSVEYHDLGLSYDQVRDMNLPTRPAKRKAAADLRWPYPFAAELDAIPPDTLREIVREAIEGHLSPFEMYRLRSIEAMERETIMKLLGRSD